MNFVPGYIPDPLADKQRATVYMIDNQTGEVWMYDFLGRWDGDL